MTPIAFIRVTHPDGRQTLEHEVRAPLHLEPGDLLRLVFAGGAVGAVLHCTPAEPPAAALSAAAVEGSATSSTATARTNQ